MNMAAIWNLPTVFLCENNQYMESRRFEKVTAGPGIHTRAEGYIVKYALGERIGALEDHAHTVPQIGNVYRGGINVVPI